jgi:hypothetical protein
MRDQLRAEWFGGGAHALENSRYLLPLALGQLELTGEHQDMHWTGITVQFGRFRHAHPFAGAQRGVTASYWSFTLTDGALRMLVLLHFYALGYTPFMLASLFLLTRRPASSPIWAAAG